MRGYQGEQNLSRFTTLRGGSGGLLPRSLLFSCNPAHPTNLTTSLPPSPPKSKPNWQELRRLEAHEPPIRPHATPSEHASAWAEAASVPSEAELARRVAAGRNSERVLLEAHAGLKHALASAAAPLGSRRTTMRVQVSGTQGLEHGDFLGEARAALLRAAAAYDPRRGSSLSSLAALAGRRSLGDFAAAHGRVIAAPKTARYAVAAMAKARKGLMQERERRGAGDAADARRRSTRSPRRPGSAPRPPPRPSPPRGWSRTSTVLGRS